MLRAFSSIRIVRAVVFLLQHKSWRDECKLVARDPTEDIRVGIRRVSWILQEEQDHSGVGDARGVMVKTIPPCEDE